MHTVTIGPHQVVLKIRHHSRSRNIRIRIDGSNLSMTLPPKAGQKDVDKFLRDYEPQIIKLLDKRPVLQPFPTDVLTILGTSYRLKIDPVRTKGVWPEDGVLWIGGKSKYPHKVLEQWLVDHAHAFFTAHAHAHAKHLGRKILDIRIRDTKSSWGSCRKNGTLTFTWRLLLAPREVAEYVSFHEICHLKEMNHGPKFWNLVESFCPDHKQHRKWLRTEGKVLAQVRLEEFLEQPKIHRLIPLKPLSILN